MKYLTALIRILFLGLFIFLVTQGKMMFWLGLFGLSLIVSMFFGRVYCGYACPMNTLMVSTDWLAKKLKIQTDRRPKWLSSGWFGWFTLGGSLAFTIFTQRVLKQNIPILLIWLGVAVLVTLRFRPTIFHKLICPFGPLLKIFGRTAWFSERVETSSCIGCKKCEKVCPSSAITVSASSRKAAINKAYCLQCKNCRTVCPKDCIGYSKA